MASQSSNPKHIPSLDGIRALSITVVFLAHAGLSHIVPGGYGVTVFFFLSGYLITTLLIREHDKSGTVSIKKFYIRRTLRIFPPMYLALGLILIVAVAAPIPENRFTGTSVFSLATFWSNYYSPQDGWNLPAGSTAFWSLAIEEHYYLIFPVTFLLLLRRFSPRSTGIILLGFCIVALVWRYVLVIAMGHDHDRIYYQTDSRFDNILYGSAFALLWNPVLGAEWRRPRWQLTGLAVLCGFLTLMSFAYRDETFRNTVRYSIQGAVLMPLFFYVIQYRDTLAYRFLNWKPIEFLGKLSYSFYLLHVLVIMVIEEHLNLAEFHMSVAGRQIPLHLVLQGAIAFSLTLLLSWIVYLFVEQPAARLKKRLGQPRA